MTKVWVIRGGDDNRLVDAFVDNGVIGVGYYTVPEGAGLRRREIEQCLRDEGTSASVEWHAAMFEAFTGAVALDDFVVMPDTPRGEIVVGRVTGPYRYEAQLPVEQYRHRRTVDWCGRHAIAELPPDHQDLYRQRPTLTERTASDLLDHLRHVANGEIGRPASDRGRRSSGGGQPTTPSLDRTCSECGRDLRPDRFPAASHVCWDCG